MKRIGLACAGLAVVWLFAAVTAQAKSDENKTGDTSVVSYEGSQNWPTGESASIIKDYAVPIYRGLPNKSYKVLGRIVDMRSGVGEVGKAFDQAFDSENHRLRNCANQAKSHGGDAVLVTDDERILKALDLTPSKARDSSPLSNDQHKVVLIIKF